MCREVADLRQCKIIPEYLFYFMVVSKVVVRERLLSTES